MAHFRTLLARGVKVTSLVLPPPPAPPTPVMPTYIPEGQRPCPRCGNLLRKYQQCAECRAIRRSRNRG